MKTWDDYRAVWATHPLLLAYFVTVLAVFALAVYATIAVRHGPLLYLFIPALGALYAHHFMVIKRLN